MMGPLFDDPRRYEAALNQTTNGVIPRMVEELFNHINTAPSHIGISIL